MTVNKLGSDIIRHEGSKPAQGAEQGDDQQRVVREVDRVERSDRVDISSEGRALVAAEAAGVSPDRIEQIRQRLVSGFYDASQVADEVAQRLLESGDLD